MPPASMHIPMLLLVQSLIHKSWTLVHGIMSDILKLSSMGQELVVYLIRPSNKSRILQGHLYQKQ